MTPENLATIHELYDAMNRKDLATLQRLAAEHPDHRWRNAPDMPEPAERDGRSGLAYAANLFETWDLIHTTVRDVIEVGPDAAIFRVHHRARGAASGVDTEREEVHLWFTRDGRIVRMEEFLTVDEARRAVAA